MNDPNYLFKDKLEADYIYSCCSLVKNDSDHFDVCVGEENKRRGDKVKNLDAALRVLAEKFGRLK